MTAGIRDALRASDVFQGLSDEELAKVEALGERQTHEEGQLLVEEDGASGRCFLLLSGRVDIEVRPPFDARGRQKIASVKPGQLLGEVSLLDGFLRSATARAAERCEVLALEDHRLRELMESDPRIGYRVMRNLARLLAARIRDTNMRLRNTLSEMLYY